ncbi:Dynein regulatory complex subunit 3 [Rhizophlyctis rosea]|uniref:Dynein regulatory complex subunit 3 n=1 Tax=Rhizophlyctis rosea TaxID=64517 RepID=A0AAD5X035_9FUNG|nr:Dynein regulatory complex subunit 3 [Rhizophlyctis rosea]
MSYTTIEPTVIDDDLIRKAASDQVSREIAEIARKEGIDPSDVTSLRLDFKNILKIDNLWAFENLTKLQLDNNIIERIENIGFLKNLQWLDLSFNNITTIEGLEGLTKLTDLTLYNNRISKLENLEDLVNLTVFSIGNNNLLSLEDVSIADSSLVDLTYLTRFPNLRVLNAAGNALCKNPNYKHWVLAHIRNLKYLDYRLVDSESVAAAREKYIDDLIAQEEEEKLVTAKKEDDKKREEQNALYESANLTNIDTLFDSMFNDDPDFQKLRLISPDHVHELREEYRAKFEVIVGELKHFVLKRTQEKKDEFEMFERCTKEAKGVMDDECVRELDRFQHLKKQLLRQISLSRTPDETDDHLRTLKHSSQQLSDFLLSSEMQLVEQFEDVVKEFERNYTELSGGINEYGQNSFARLRELENEHHERFGEVVLGAYERFSKGDVEEVEEELRELMADKDALVNAINGSHDFRLGKFDQQEDALVSGVTKDLESVVQKTHDAEVQRNRDRVCEIVAFLDKVAAEVEQAEENAY